MTAKELRVDVLLAGLQKAAIELQSYFYSSSPMVPKLEVCKSHHEEVCWMGLIWLIKLRQGSF